MKSVKMLIGGVCVLSMLLLAFWLLQSGISMVCFAWVHCVGYPWMAAHITASGLVIFAIGCVMAFFAVVGAVLTYEANTKPRGDHERG